MHSDSLELATDTSARSVPTQPPISADDLSDQFMQARGRLRAMIQARLHPLVAARLDASDVLQETYIEANRRLEEYQTDPRLPVFLWLRRLGIQTLARIHRDHLDRAKRDPTREIVVAQGSEPSSFYKNGLARELSVSMASPASQVAQNELLGNINEVIESLSDVDQQILGLRHLEHLTLSEAATEIGITTEAAKQRYRRAIRKLASVLNPSAGSQSDG